MKNILSLALLCVAGVATLQATKDPREMVEIARELKGKTIEFPQELVAKKHALMARSLEFKAEHIKDMAASLKDTTEKAKYVTISKELTTLAKDIKGLKAMPLKHTFKDPQAMLELKAEWKALKAEMMKLIGEKLNNKKIIERADKHVQWAEELEKAVAENKE